MKVNTINLGIYETDKRRKYSCRFFKDTRKVIAIGPLPMQAGVCADIFRGYAENEEEAFKKIAAKLGPGHFSVTSSQDG